MKRDLFSLRLHTLDRLFLSTFTLPVIPAKPVPYLIRERESRGREVNGPSPFRKGGLRGILCLHTTCHSERTCGERSRTSEESFCTFWGGGMSRSLRPTLRFFSRPDFIGTPSRMTFGARQRGQKGVRIKLPKISLTGIRRLNKTKPLLTTPENPSILQPQ